MLNKMIKIFDVNIYPFKQGELINYCLESLKDCKKIIIMYVNIHVLNLAYNDKLLTKSLLSADRVYCDGEGVRWGAKLLGQYLPIRTTGADWIYNLSEQCQKNNYSLFFLGGEAGVAEAAAKYLKQKFPKLLIVGTEDGYFNTTGEKNDQRIKRINDSGADIVIVGLGTPLQENWIVQNSNKINSKVLWAVGGLFGYLAGTEKRAPEIMHKNGLEWLYRLLANPRRLFNRYLLGNPLFFIRILKSRK